MNSPLNPANPAPAIADSAPRRDPLTRWILVAFGVIVLAMLVAMLPSYILFSNTDKGERLMNKGEYARAIPPLLKVVTDQPGAWGRQRQLGDCYLAVDKPQEALKCYQRARQDNPELDLDEKIGIALLESGDKTQAMTYFSKVLAKNPDSPATNYYLGVQQFEAGNTMQAAKHFQAAAGDPKWDKKAEPWRQKVAAAVLGPASKPIQAEKSPTPNQAVKQ